MIKIDDICYNIQIWDTAGQEVYQSITKTYYKRSDGLILLYDVNDESSFIKIEKWLKDIEANANENTLVYLVGNKIDLIGQRAVSNEKAENIAKSMNRKYFEISAMLGINLKETVYSLVKEILKKKNFGPINIVMNSENDRNNTGGSCCLAKKDNKKEKNKKKNKN